jgi:glutathione peroxidase
LQRRFNNVTKLIFMKLSDILHVFTKVTLNMRISIMTKTRISILITVLFFFLSCMANNNNVSRPSEATESADSGFYSFKLKSLDGDTIDFSKYKGKKVLIVNTASKCGFTPQYEELQKLHTQYGDKVTVLGFPCNQFGGQEPGTSSEIVEFCKKNYGVTFQMFEKLDVKGNDQHPLYKWLTDKSLNGWNDKAPGWNFCKYLVNEKGELVEFYGSTVSPTGNKIVGDISK